MESRPAGDVESAVQFVRDQYRVAAFDVKRNHTGPLAGLRRSVQMDVLHFRQAAN